MYALGLSPGIQADGGRAATTSPSRPPSLWEEMLVPWGRCDDTYYRHPKVGDLDEAVRKGCNALYWLAISWANDHLTDGHIPTGTLRTLGADVEEADELVRVGLWERSDRGYVIHDWSDFNQTKVHVLEIRALRSDIGKRGAASRHNNQLGNLLGNAPSNAAGKPPSIVHSKDDAPVPRTPYPKNPIDRPLTQRQFAHRWLRDHGAHAPTGWANGLVNELIKVYGVKKIVGIWEAAPKDVRTSNQYARYAEHELNPSMNGVKPESGKTRSAQEAEDAFNG